MAIGKITSKALAAAAAMPPSGGTFTGDVTFQGNINGAYSLPTSDGTANQVLTTDGSGTITFADAGGGGGGGADLYAANESSPSAQPSATGTNAIAIGDSAISTGTNSFAGPNSRAQNSNTVALGINSNSSSYGALGNFSVAIGYQAKAANSWAMSIGRDAISTQNESFAIGKSLAGGDTSFAAQITNNTSSYGASGANSIALGRLAKASNTDSVSIGYNNRAVGVRSIAAGYNNLSYTDGFCFGNGNGSQSASIAAGRNNNAWGNGSVAIGDGNEVASNANGGIVIGQSCDVNADHDRAIAIGSGAQTRAKGHRVYANYSSTYQSGRWILFTSTTDATAKDLSTDNGAASTANQIVLPNDSCYGFTGTVIAREDSSATNDFAVWEIKGGAVRAASASTTALGTYNINKISESTGATNWSIALSADTTNGAVAITVTGEASHNIRWVATVNTTEVTY